MVLPAVQNTRVTLLSDDILDVLLCGTLPEAREHLCGFDDCIAACGPPRCSHVVLTDVTVGRGDCEDPSHWVGA